ncbi:uncharacterized protein L3040_005503 [Drepanopeziza brunnea f. sp. 'multigermtubi']|uniref:Haloacid dehalogenase, type II n=1 Tax=Marssonina brunnea f. sp. multigermtubi (strain MB_m1) TaxID=1072389 RepID=K1XN23_MARBU|nr:haloacid dehalogenase, type II [Drepanopeziza brunnea f. sp. 'multigermtubi' MB_m1]EKD13884.1 haloacid dehalogenase, type II [Drepanopeziza brunnea f. sp. 'multigermtubi' MB_m1]KAJ5040944.1 hypothetical protein L3040_005503 [Drepanopeziza brunnea f. sp. 'multigermtubi']
MASKSDIFQSPPKALTFDVFGTVVNWRDTVVSKLIQSAAAKTSPSSSRSADLSSEVRKRLSELDDDDWARFAAEWRKSYYLFTQAFVPGETRWRDIDTHHHLALIELLQRWGLEGLYTADELEELSRVWHFLDPWEDSSPGLRKLGTKFVTSTLSNGNQALLKDLREHGDLRFEKLQSSADFKAYKPHPSVYQGAAKAMGLQTSEVAMVAAHLADLKGARQEGFKTIYVDRPQEEAWSHDSEEYKDAKEWVDIWVKQDEGGFLELARRFGIN